MVILPYELRGDHETLECNNVKHIKHFQKWWKEITGNEIVLDYELIVSGVNPHNPDVLLNLCIIIIIIKSRFGHHILNISYFKPPLKFNYDFEMQISVKNNTLYKHS